MAVTSLIVVTLCLAVGQVTSAATDKKTECGFESKGVYIAVTSEAEKVNDEYLRWLEAHWFGMVDVEDGDWVGLWSHDPEEGLGGLLDEYPVSTTDGSFRTGQRWNGSLIPDDLTGTQDRCLPYWVGYVNKGMLTHSSCLMIRPHWLSGLRTSLMDTRLSKVVLPGSHDAGASGHFGLAIIGDLVGRWTFTQDESLWQQLVLGSRYLDMRIAYYNTTQEKFFVNHGEVRIAPLQGYLDNVVAFMEQTEEIVIFDVHGLQHGFDGHPERHEELIKLLESNFQKWMVPKSLSPDPTLGEIWTSGSRLIVTYPSSEASASPYFWNNVYHLWGDVNKLEDLEAFLYTSVPQQVTRGSLWSSMAELTPSVMDVTLDRWGGLRGAAAVTNTPVTQWVREDLWDQVNIVAMDFLPASDVVAIAIEANKLKTECVGKKRLTNRARRWLSVMANYVKDVQAVVGNQRSPRIWLWVSALASTSEDGQVTQRQLEVNWEVPEVLEGDWIGIFDHDPSLGSASHHESFQPAAEKGYFVAKASLPHLRVHASMDEALCLGWWAAYIRDGSPLTVDCVKVHPRWMSSLKNQMYNIPLHQIVIPGTHDSGTYTPYSLAAENALMKYAVTQDESIYSQLVHGNRYIDLRAGYLVGDTEEPFWVVHGVTVWRPLRDALQEIKAFVQETGEVVLLEVGGFTWFESSATHDDCISLIVEELGDIMAPKSLGWNVHFGDVLESSASLLVIYDHDEAINHLLMWPRIDGRWANAQTIDGLQSYMEKIFDVDGPPPSPWTLGGQLTPLANDVILDTLGGLRTMADEVNRNVTRWMRERWWQNISVFSCDFFLSAGYVEVAIEINIRRLL
ncbi:uncharacterized protein LOC134783317 isoform X2 [Penaeus indicus]